VESDDGQPPARPSDEDIVDAHRLAVLHRRIAVPGQHHCLWCGEPWPCEASEWAAEVLRASEGGEPGTGP
jgi:hypothetical protein